MAEQKEESTKQEATAQTDESGAKKSSNTALKVILIIVGVLVVLGILGIIAISMIFKAGSDKLNEFAQQAEQQMEEERENSDSEQERELPDGFPASVPLFEPASLDSTGSRQQSNGDVSYSLIYTTESNVDDVASFYKEELKQNGWEISETYTQNDTQYIRADNESQGLAFSVNMTPKAGDNETVFSITVKQKAD